MTQTVHADDSSGGNKGMYSYNSFSEPVRYTDELGNTWSYTYDSKGDLINEENPLLYNLSQASGST